MSQVPRQPRPRGDAGDVRPGKGHRQRGPQDTEPRGLLRPGDLHQSVRRQTETLGAERRESFARGYRMSFRRKIIKN